MSLTINATGSRLKNHEQGVIIYIDDFSVYTIYTEHRCEQNTVYVMS